jgi:dolichyl-phosphooligosaccharide-protein glycotransferase
MEQVNSKAIAKTKKQLKKIPDKQEKLVLIRRVNPLISIFVIFSICFVVLFPNRVIGESTAGSVMFAPSNAWCESLAWLKSNTPEPFDNPDYYYEDYQYPTAARPFTYPQSAYSVASWWDYGYWITRMGHRIPVSNPGTNHNGEANYFMADSEQSADEMINKWNTKYIILNVDMSGVRSKFYAISTLSGNDVYKYVDVFFTESNGKLQPLILYYPAYFQTMVVRLYNFGGAAFNPSQSMVVTYTQNKAEDGVLYNLITSSKTFDTYDAALSYLAGLKTNDLAGIFSSNAYSSPIPLEQLKHYKLVHDSTNNVSLGPGVMIPEVRIFEYSK